MLGRIRNIQVYRSREGRIPYREWLDSLRDRAGAANIRARINRLRLGNPGDSKSVGEGLCELRIDFGPGYRVYFAQKGEEMILLLCGGDKQSQDRDIETARRYWMDYEKRTDET